LFFDLLENSKLTVDEVNTECECPDESCNDNWDGVTHVHILDSANDSTIQMKTHYNAEQEQYSLLEYVVIVGPPHAVTDVKNIVERGKTSEQLQERMGEQEEPSDEHMAKIYEMFPDAQPS
jgi:diaminopimelate epimerase